MINSTSCPRKPWSWVRQLCLAMLTLFGAFHATVATAGDQAMKVQDWAQTAPNLPLTPHLRYFKETPGDTLNWRQALDSGDWLEADPKGMAATHKPATMWMQVEVVNTGSTLQTRLVAVDYWALMDVQLFVLDARQARLLAHLRSGQRLAPGERAMHSEKPVFAVTLMPGQRARLLIRVSDLYWSHMKVEAWESAAYARAQTGYRLGFAVVLGAALALFVVLLLQRNKTFTLVAVWMLLSLLLELTYAGLVSEFLLPVRVLAPVMLLLLLGVLINSASAFVAMYFMGLDRHRFWRRWNWVLFVVSLVLALWALDARSNTMRQAMSLLNAVQIVSNLSMLAWAKLRGHKLRQWMAVIMVTNFSLAIGRIAVRQFYVEPETFVALMNAALFVKGSLILTVIVLVALQRQRDMNEVRERLRLAEQRQREDLQSAVDQRTAELHQALAAANDANLAKTDFLARVSHDLRSPLTTISGYAQLLQRVGGRTGSLAQTIRRSADHMLVMVNDLIEFARGASGDRAEPVPVYIHSLLADVAREADALSRRRNNRFALRLETELPSVLVLDAKRLRQMLINLLDNAAKFTHNGSVELLGAAQPVAARDGQVGRLELQLIVRDSGDGIALTDQAKLFEPFYRTASAVGVSGVGLGLSIVRTWAERLGGTVALVSAPGQGSSFTLRLPVQQGAEADMSRPQWQDDAAYLPPLDGGGQCIWLVEDNTDIRELLTEELRATGFVVVASPDGRDFLVRMRAAGVTPPSLVLTDYLMPGADGAAVLKAVRQCWPGVPVVLLSATQKTMQSMGVAKDEGFDASLMKPINLADLRNTLARVLRIELRADNLVTVPGALDTPTLSKNSILAAKPSAEELQCVCQWVDMGAWTDLTEWAEALPQRRPECAEFARRMLSLLAQARFAEIRTLCFEANSP